MARRNSAPKRDLIPDPIFGDDMLAKFINCLMKNGKKSVAEKMVYGALRRVGERTDLNALKEVGEKNPDSQQSDSRKEENSFEKLDPSLVSGSVDANLKDLQAKVKAEPIIKDLSNSLFRRILLGKFSDALEAISPKVEVKSRRVGGATYQVPIEVQPRRRMALAMRWLIEGAISRSEKTMMLRLAGEILDALEGRGAAVKKREDMHRMAKANQAFAHYRW